MVLDSIPACVTTPRPTKLFLVVRSCKGLLGLEPWFPITVCDIDSHSFSRAELTLRDSRQASCEDMSSQKKYYCWHFLERKKQKLLLSSKADIRKFQVFEVGLWNRFHSEIFLIIWWLYLYEVKKIWKIVNLSTF